MKTTQVLAVLAVLFTVASCEDDLKCFVCAECSPNFVDHVTDANTETCPNILLAKARCVKEIIGGVINRRCGTTVDCTGYEAFTECDGDDLTRTCGVCCDTDKCNSAITFHVSAIVLLVAAAVHKFLF